MSTAYKTYLVNANPNASNSQRFEVKVENGQITATANKKLSGLKVPKLTYKNGKWTTNGQDAKNFIKYKKNLENLNRFAKSVYKDLSESEQKKVDFDLGKDNTASVGDQEGSLDGSEPVEDYSGKFNLDNIKVDIPRDPEGFFIGRYPINQKDTSNFDFLKITCYDYEPGIKLDVSGDSLFKIDDIDKRIKKRRGVVSLPMQPGISENNSVNWGNNEINPIQLAGAQAAAGAVGQMSNVLTGRGFDMQGIMKTLGETGSDLMNAVGEDAIKAYFAGQAVGANILTRGTGLTINNNLEVLFNGPNLRSFSYNYRFTPREPKEADKIKQIIRFFKKQMAPKRSTSRIFLKSPNVFKLKYTYKNGDPHPFLNNIKICALNQFSVDYTPDGSYSTYEDDGGRGDGSMTSYQVSLGFMEMTPIYNDDFWNDDEGKEGTGF
jgi:thymidylate synthase